MNLEDLVSNKKRCYTCKHFNCEYIDCEECPIYGQCEPYNGDFENWHLCPCVEHDFDVEGDCPLYERCNDEELSE